MRLIQLYCLVLLVFFSGNLIACNKKALPSSLNEAPVYKKSSSIVSDILMYVNEHRKAEGLPAVQLLDAASAEATKHSADMAFRRTPFGHEGFDERMATISKNAGYLFGMAENVAYGHLDAKQVVDLWINSPAHKKNMEGNYNYTGIGLAQAKDGTVYFTQIFVRK
ncbi:MAG: CAP domain-containing protein [Panacibacter sp.]